MKLIVQPSTIRDNLPGLIYGIIGIVGFFTARLFDNILLLIPPCIIKMRFGIPCPACGASRSGIELAHFHIWNALILNPLFFIIYFTIVLWAANSVAGVLFKQNIHFNLTAQEGKVLRIGILLIVPLNWIYLVIVNFH